MLKEHDIICLLWNNWWLGKKNHLQSNSWTSAWKTKKKEMIPHEERWFALPTVGKEGFPFSWKILLICLGGLYRHGRVLTDIFRLHPACFLLAVGLDDGRSVGGRLPGCDKQGSLLIQSFNNSKSRAHVHLRNLRRGTFWDSRMLCLIAFQREWEALSG